MSLDNVQHIILVLSGKGGVGKSSVTVQLALALSRSNPTLRIGVLDIDLTGPNIPRMFAVESSKVHQAPSGWIPVSVPTGPPGTHGSITCMSLAFLLSSRSDSVVWRGPKKTAMVRQFLSDVNWGQLDYLLIDTPPGTSDEHISLAETLLQPRPGVPFRPPTGAVLVTTPQAISTSDVRKELNFCKKVGLRILGVVENMSGYVCPHCAECTNIFSKGGGAVMAEEFGVEFFGSVPIDPGFNLLVESQRQGEGTEGANPVPLVESYGGSPLYPIFKGVAERLKVLAEEVDGK